MTAVCVARLKKELQKLKKDPNQYFETIPLKEDIKIWHFVLRGPEKTDYEGGLYWGQLKFPHDYPYKPPSIMLFTPNGRFQINVKICLSNSDYHPESWSPFWSVNNILTGFVSFMTEESNGMGSMHSNAYHRKLLAKQSLLFNCKNQEFNRVFPQYYQLYQQQIRDGSLNQEMMRAHTSSNLTAQPAAPQTDRPHSRDKMFDWLIITLIVMAIAYGW
eukprot:CAMPEP_0197035958 /NCGR_PEP_ID=MMETSP1384-20130603/13605_1 /TAXON_ID=29189 /ORGANISM="Ammonia sp." /LENGTH=216 /DNA_ID=CAMNT_0042466077 /DNA_START=17 /DNA_END=664 /DNA_ORIENTATION=+